MKALVHLPIGRIIRPLEMEGKSVLQLLFWNRFRAFKIAETKLEHKWETLNFCKAVYKHSSHYCKAIFTRKIVDSFESKAPVSSSWMVFPFASVSK